MVHFKSVFTSLVLLSVVALAQAQDATTPKTPAAATDDKKDAAAAPPEPDFTPCDTNPDNTAMKQSGLTALWSQANDPVFYLSPGLSACGENYTDFSNVVCLNAGW
jgi:hypothetical protein